MRNGPYILVIAPPNYPGPRYRGRYVYEHHLVWWQRKGEVVPPNRVLHHIDGNKHNNTIANLELLTPSEHSLEHNPPPSAVCVRCGTAFRPRPGRLARARKKGWRVYCSFACYKATVQRVA